MPKAQVLFHRLAAREYREARTWYAARSADAGHRFREAVDLAVERVGRDVELFPILFGAYRWVRVGRFPYLLIFRVLSADVTLVLAVAHAKRRPGYWRRRR